MPTFPTTESEMYGPVCTWLVSLLRPRYRSYSVSAHDTSSVSLHRWLEQHNLQDFFPEYQAFDIRVDVVAVLRRDDVAHLTFVECKLRPISLRDISQLLGYCRVAQPRHAFIVSPRGLSTPVSFLLNNYGRTDILLYNDNKRIRVATWNHDRLEIDQRSLIPHGHFIRTD